MRASALMTLALWCVPARLVAQNEPATGEVIVTVRSGSGTSLAEVEGRTGPRVTLADAQGVARLSLPASRHLLIAAAAISIILLDFVVASSAYKAFRTWRELRKRGRASGHNS